MSPQPASISTEPVTVAGFRAAMGAFTTGVCVLTVRSGDGAMHGMTVNSFGSVSLDPILVQVCLVEASRGLELIAGAGVFSVSVLAGDQEDVSRWFASRDRPPDSSMFDGVPMDFGATGCPALLDACAVFDCVVDRLVPAGDHVIVLGEVVEVRHEPAVPPLLFHAGGYRSLDALGAADARPRPASAARLLKVLPESA